MWGNPFTEWLPYMSNYVVTTGANLLIHSTIILSAGLLGAYALKEKGAAAQSIVLRVFLAAFLLCTPVSIILHEAGIGGLTITVPLTTPQKPADKEFLTRTERKNVDRSNEPVLKIPARRTKTGIENETLQNKKTAVSSAKTHDRVPVRSQHTIITSAQKEKEYTPARPEIRQTEIQPENNLAVLYMLMTVVWTVLTFIVMTRLILNNLYLVYVRFTAVQAKQSFLDASKYAAHELNMRAPLVLQSPSVKSPFAAGILKQYIILPLGKHETGLPEKEVFLHELAHLKRRDPFWNLLVRITRIIIPFQPLIWIYTRWIAVTNDYVCDDYVMNSIENHRSYASDLAHLARHYHPRGHEIAAGAGFISVKSSLRRRIARILDATRKLSLRVSARLVFTISLLCAFITFVTGFIGIKGKNSVQESYASEKKSDEESEKISAKTHDTELPVRDTVVSSERYNRPPVNDTPGEITQQPENNVSEPDTAEHEESDPAPVSTETYSAAVIQHPQAADSYEIVDFPSVNTDTGPEPESSAENETIEATEKTTREFVTEKDTGEHEITNTVVLQESDVSNVSSFASQNHIGLTGSASISRGEIDNLALKVVDVVITYDFDNADLTNPEEKLIYDMYRSLENNKLYPVWSPDGAEIAFSDKRYGIWIVPVEGGEPKLVYQNDPIEYGEYSIYITGLEPLCYTPDGREITYKRLIIDESQGSDVIIDESSDSPHITIVNAIPVIETVDIETGRTRVIAKGAQSGRWSYDGRFFIYARFDAKSFKELIIRDTITGHEYEINEYDVNTIIMSPNDRYLLFSEDDLFMLPGTGGLERVSISGDVTFTDVSSDGRWILYTLGSRLFVYDTHEETSRDLFLRQNIGPNWARFSPDMLNICFSLQTKEYGWNIYLHDFTQYTGETKATEQSTPAPFELKENFPNPFNNSTTLQFNLPEHAETSLVIYNLMGQQVKKVVSDNLDIGTHTYQWYGYDDQGRRAGTGTYLAHIVSGSYRATIRMTLIK